MKINLLRPCVLGVILGLGFGNSLLAPVAQAAPKSKGRTPRLDIWPGQRPVVVLPLTVNEGFLSNGDASTTPDAGTATSVSSGGSALADALKPLLAPQLTEALKATGKFSVVQPYKFDPILRRAVAEQGLTEDAATACIETPSRATAQTVLPLLQLDQPGLVAQVVLQSLRVGGTQAAPTVQMTMRGDLYEVGSAEPFRTITVTSRPFPGETPEDRLSAAAGQAFADIAAAFVEPPTEFGLPQPSGPMSTMTNAAPGAPATSVPAMNGTIPTPTPGGMMPPPVMPAPPVSANPMAPSGMMGGPIVPTLPASTPPLGVNVPEQE